MAVIGAVGCGATTQQRTSTPASTPPRTTTTTTTPSGQTEVAVGQQGVIPVGQELDVRLTNSLSSDTAKPEDHFEATTAVDLVQNGRVLVPAGSVVRGVVSAVSPAGRVDRKGSLTLAFDRLSARGREYPIRATATQVFESEGIRGEVGTVGAGAGAGAIIGGILGGLKGALIGAIVGTGGVIAATEGKDVVLPAGTIIRLRTESPVSVR
jgi:hypothetical protein